jgi:hypothetical protein
LGLAAPKVDFDKTVTLEPGAINTYNFDVALYHRVILVQIDSREPVHVHLTRDDAAEDVRKALAQNQIPMGASGMRNITQDSFTVHTSANHGFVVFLCGAKKQTQVKLTIKTRPFEPKDKQGGPF